jgi:hypothetical protein
VTRDDIRIIFDNIKPDTPARERMLKNILYPKKRKEITMLSFNFRKAIPALVIAVILTGGMLTYGLFNRGLRGNENPDMPQRDVDFIGDDASFGAEDMPAPLLNEFQIDKRHYFLASDYVEEFGFPAEIRDEDIGPKIATIEKSPDKSLIGCEVFRYVPAGCEAVVAVKRNDEYVLFKFFTFESYNNNQDEDAIEYLKLYGIEDPEDIAKIRFIVHTEQSKLEGSVNVSGEITDRNDIAKFYNFYSVLKNSSDKYFEKLFGNIGAGNSTDVEIDVAYPVEPESVDSSVSITVDPIAPDHIQAPAASQGMMDMGETVPGAVAPSQGSAGDALANPVTIRIYNQNGVYFETMYYRNIGFISRYEVTDEFAAFMERYIR